MNALHGPEIVLVVAAADNGVIGHRGGIPWHLPADLRRFKALTMGHPLLMGRKTFESIGRPLPGRRNIVLTRQPGWAADGVETAPDLATALHLAAAGGATTLMVIGGAQLYQRTLPVAGRIELTRVHLAPQGDTFFPSPDPALWRKVASEHLPPAKDGADGSAGGVPACSFETYRRTDRPARTA